MILKTVFKINSEVPNADVRRVPNRVFPTKIRLSRDQVDNRGARFISRSNWFARVRRAVSRRSLLARGRLPELDLVAFGVDHPAELSVLRLLGAIFNLAPFGAKRGQDRM